MLLGFCICRGREPGREREGDSYIQSLMLCSSAMNYRAGIVTAI